MKRMINLGWLRQSEYETYFEATKEDWRNHFYGIYYIIELVNRL
jgi:hypothetical protein